MSVFKSAVSKRLCVICHFIQKVHFGYQSLLLKIGLKGLYSGQYGICSRVFGRLLHSAHTLPRFAPTDLHILTILTTLLALPFLMAV